MGCELIRAVGGDSRNAACAIAARTLGIVPGQTGGDERKIDRSLTAGHRVADIWTTGIRIDIHVKRGELPRTIDGPVDALNVVLVVSR